MPVTIKTKRGEQVVATDEAVRPDTSLEKLAKLRPAFMADGTVTAGNASGINDGAAALVLMNKAVADREGIHYLAVIDDYLKLGLIPTSWAMHPS